MKAVKLAVLLFAIVLAGCAKTPAAPAVSPGAGTDGDPTAAPPVAAAPGIQPANPGQPAAQNATTPGAPATAPAPPPEPPSPLKYIGLRAEPEIVDMGHPAVIIVTVNNTSDKYGVFPVELKIDGSTYSIQTVSLPAGAAGNLTFNIIPIAERNMMITAGPLVKELVIQHS